VARAIAAALLAVALCAAPASAQSGGAPAGFELSRSVQQTLLRIQELWLQWVGATLQDNVGKADESLRSLTVAAREVGFRHLPDLSLAALAQARRSAANGDIDRARRQLAAAEQLDPDRPDSAFTSAAVARADGDWVGWASGVASGIGRVWRGPERIHLLATVAIWGLLVLLVTAGGYVLLLVGVHGAELLRALRRLLPEGGFAWASVIVLLAVLVGPVLLPYGPFILLLVWSALIWSYASASERILIALGWLLVVTAPLAVDRLQRQVALEESPPMRAVEAFDGGRLYGALFADLQVLRTALPGDPLVTELAGDVHRTLGQWDLARSLYRRVLVEEPDNAPVLLNLGAYHFRKGEFAIANGYFQRATRSEHPSAAAWYNLSLGLSESYAFGESREALAHARSIDAAAVDGWMATTIPDKVLTFNGSLTRVPELRRALLAAWVRKGGSSEVKAIERLSPTVLALAALVVALGFDVLRRRRAEPRSRREPRGRGAPARWLRILLPAVDAAEAGRGWMAWLNLLLLAVLALLPLAFQMAGEFPVFGWPDSGILVIPALAGAFLYAAWRVRSGLVEAEG